MSTTAYFNQNQRERLEIKKCISPLVLIKQSKAHFEKSLQTEDLGGGIERK